MKTSRFLLIVFSMFFLSCMREQVGNVSGDDGYNGQECQLTVETAVWEAPKTSYKPGTGVSLDDNEPLILFYKTDKLYNANVKATPAEAHGKYTFTIPDSAPSSSTWYSLMPYSKTITTLNSNGTTGVVRLGPVQFPKGNSFDPSADFLVGKPFSITTTDRQSYASIYGFKRLFTPFRLLIQGLDASDKIYSVTLSFSQKPEKAGQKALTGLYYISLADTYDDTGIAAVEAKSMGNAVSAVYPSGLEKTDDGWPVWFIVNPSTIKSGSVLSLTITTAYITYKASITLSSNATFNAEVLNTLKFDLSNKKYSECSSVTQDFTGITIKSGDMQLTASDGNVYTWPTTARMWSPLNNDGGSFLPQAMLLNGTQITFPELEGKRITGARIFTHPASRSYAGKEVTFSIKDDTYNFNLSNDPVEGSMAYTGGVLEVTVPNGETSLEGLTLAASGENHIISAITLLTEDDKPVDPAVFSLLDMEYQPLATVKDYYRKGDYVHAADALLSYFKGRTAVKNVDVSLPVTKLYTTEEQAANDALKENGYRFTLRKGTFFENYSGGVYTYYSFLKDGKINWELSPEKEGSEFYQKHWHAWFTDMGKAYSYSKDKKYFRAWKEQYSDWMKNYPCPSTGATYSDKSIAEYGYKSWAALSMASRIINQTGLFEYFKGCDEFDFEWLTTFLTAFDEAVEYSVNHPYYEEYSNIRITQYKAACLAGILFPELKNSEKWLKYGADASVDAFWRLFNSDGCLKELDLNYHETVVEDYISIYQYAKANERLSYFPADYVSNLGAACHFFMDSIYPNYLWECFNDTKQTTRNVSLRRLKTYSELFPDDTALSWMASERKSGTKPTIALAVYPVSGYYMFHSSWDENSLMLIYKNNYNPSNAWHANKDNGTVAVYCNGRIFLPDAGSYTYGGGDMDKVRKEFQATARHNTITLELEDIPDNYSKGRCLKTGSDNQCSYVVAENDSYSNLTHRRTVWMVDKSFFVILDAAYGACSGKNINISWHLCRDASKGTDVVVYDNKDGGRGAHTVFDDGNNMVFRTFYSKTTELTVSTGESDYSETTGQKQSRKFYRLGLKKSSSSEAIRYITIICPTSVAGTSEITAEFADKGFSPQTGESIKVKVGGKEYSLSYTL